MATPQFLYDDPGNDTKDSRPCFNAAGDKVVFMREVAGASSLWTVEVATGVLAQLYPHQAPTKNTNEATRPDWSWLDDRIAFSGSHELSGVQKQGLFIIDAVGTNPPLHVPVSVAGTHITGTGISYPSWYPGGTHIAVTDANVHRILKVTVSSGDATALTKIADILTGQSSVNQQDTDQICAAAQLPGSTPYNQDNNHVWVQATGTLHSIQVSGHGHGRAPWWSPDGQRIAYESDYNTTSGQYAIYIYHRSDQSIRPVTPRYGWGCAHAKFHPTIPNLIVVGATKTGDRGGIAIVDFDTST